MPVYRTGDDAFDSNSDGRIELTYPVADLLKRLRTNRAEHKKQYAEAMRGFRKQVIQKCQERLRQAKANDSKATDSILLAEPENHLAEYDTVIEMLEMTKDEEMVLDYSQFQRLVRDNWEWKGRFAALYAGYSEGV